MLKKSSFIISIIIIIIILLCFALKRRALPIQAQKEEEEGGGSTVTKNWLLEILAGCVWNLKRFLKLIKSVVTDVKFFSGVGKIR